MRIKKNYNIFKEVINNNNMITKKSNKREKSRLKKYVYDFINY